MKLPARAGRGRVDRHDAPEADAERAEAGEPHRAHGEVGVAREDLDPDGPFDAIAVARLELLERLVGIRGQVRLEQRRLLATDEELQASDALRLVAVEAVEQVERVLGPDVVGIAGEGGLEARPPARDVAEAEQVQSQRGVAAPRAGVETQRFAGELRGLPVETVADAQLRERSRRGPRSGGGGRARGRGSP